MFKVIKIKKDTSKRGYGQFYWVFMRDLKNNCSCRTYVGTSYGNFARWEKVIMLKKRGEEVYLSGLLYKRKGLIDADSVFSILDSNIVKDVNREVAR